MTFASLFLGPFVEVKFKTLKQLRDLLSSIEIFFVCYSHIILLIQHERQVKEDEKRVFL